MKNVLQEAQHPPQAEAVEEERIALAHLRAHGKKTQRVGSVRVGNERLSEAPGTMPVAAAPGAQAGASKKPLGQQNRKFQIYDSSASASAEAPKMPGRHPQKENQLPTDKRRNQENTLNPGKWTEAKMGRKAAVPVAAAPARPSFSVHQVETVEYNNLNAYDVSSDIIYRCDQDEGIASSAPSQQQGRFRLETRVLKAKDDGPPVPLAIFEPPDPTKRPMYAKHLVYQGRTQLNKITDTTQTELNLPT